MEDRRIRKTKSALQKSLYVLMKEKSLHQITVKDIVETADINRSTFYHYYNDVPDMVKHLGDELYQKFYQQITVFIKSDLNGDIRERAIEFIEQICIVIKENEDFCRCIFNENGDISFVQRAEALIDYYNTFLDVRKYISLPSNETDHLIAFFKGGCMECFRSWMNHDFKETPREMAVLIYEFRNNLLKAFAGENKVL